MQILQAMVHDYERKGNSQAQKGVWGFQESKININYSSIFFPLVVFVEKVTYNLINLKD